MLSLQMITSILQAKRMFNGVKDSQEYLDGTCFNDPCDYLEGSQDYSSTTQTWKDSDCDGDGLTNGEEVDPDEDGVPDTDGNESDPSDPCDPNANSVACTGGCDLYPNMTFGSTTYVVGDDRVLVINVNEILDVNTDGTEIRVFVPYSAGFTYSFDSTLTSVTVVGTETVNNGDWSMTDTGTGMLFSMTATIYSSDRNRIAIDISADTAGTDANITGNIMQNSGGEILSHNNITVLAQSIQN